LHSSTLGHVRETKNIKKKKMARVVTKVRHIGCTARERGGKGETRAKEPL